MELAYSSKKLRQLCEVAAAAEQFFGLEEAQQFRSLLSDIDAADSAGDLPIGNPRLSDVNSQVTLRLDLETGWTLVFNAFGVSVAPPKRLNAVKRLMLVDVEVIDE